MLKLLIIINNVINNNNKIINNVNNNNNKIINNINTDKVWVHLQQKKYWLKWLKNILTNWKITFFDKTFLTKNIDK